MKESEKLEKELSNIHKNIITAIVYNIKRIKKIIEDFTSDEEFSEIRLPNPILYQTVDDQFNEVIGSVSINEKEAIIDDNISDYRIVFEDLNTNVLVTIVRELETLKTFEEIEEYLI